MKKSGTRIFYIVSLCLLVGVFYLWAMNSKNSLQTFEEKQLTKSLPTIIIDCGHGGIDGGAVGISGVVEKDINLNIGLFLRELLQQDNYKVVMTRETDVLIYDDNAKTIRKQKNSDLHNRLKIANSTQDGILVSIHQNHFSESKYNGAQFFYSKNNPLSKDLALKMQSIFKEQLQPNNEREIKQSGKEIYLLYNAKIPAVMAECGFLSNKEEEQLLASEQYQHKIAELLAKAIVEFCQSES